VPPEPIQAQRLDVALTVNGESRTMEAGATETLLDALRDRLGLTGTKECCAEGECGACTVLIDGEAVNSCLVLAAEAADRSVTTIEGLGAPDRLSPVQQAFVAAGAVQCGFCIPGMVVSAHYLLEGTPLPTVDEIREGLSGNLCRCGGYNQICNAVSAAAEEMAETSGKP
jgi:carbon-monoxide dehydrogenase small subunit